MAVSLMTIIRQINIDAYLQNDLFLANMKHWSNVGLLLRQRRRQKANSKPTLGQRLMFAGMYVT